MPMLYERCRAALKRYMYLDRVTVSRQTPGRFVPAIGKRLKKSFVPGKKMLHKAMMQSGKTFRDDAKQIMENIFGDD